MTNKDSVDSIALEEGRRILDNDIDRFESIRNEFRSIIRMNLLILGVIGTLLNLSASQPSSSAIVIVVIPFLMSIIVSIAGTQQVNPNVGVHHTDLVAVLQKEREDVENAKGVVINTYSSCMNANRDTKSKLAKTFILAYSSTFIGVGAFFGYFLAV